MMSTGNEPISAPVLFRLPDIMDICGLTEIQVKHHVVRGIIIPYEEHYGTGRAHRYDFRNVVEFLICAAWGLFEYRIRKDLIQQLKAYSTHQIINATIIYPGPGKPVLLLSTDQARSTFFNNPVSTCFYCLNIGESLKHAPDRYQKLFRDERVPE